MKLTVQMFGAALALAAAGVWVVASLGEGPGEVGMEGRIDRTGEGPGAAPIPEGPLQAEARTSEAGRALPMAGAAESRRPFIDVLVLAADGTPLFGSARPEANWLQPWLLDVGATGGDPLGGSGAHRLPRHGPRSSSEPGWYTSIPRPLGTVEIGLVLGRDVVARAPVPPAADRVVLRFDPSEFRAVAGTITGHVLGWRPEREKLVLSGDALTEPRRVTSMDGDRFRFDGVPSGPFRLELLPRGDSPERRALDGGLASERWTRWVAFLTENGGERTAVLEGRLARGATLDVGEVAGTRVVGAVLDLTGPRGGPIDASGAQVLLLSGAGDVASGPDFQRYGSLVALYPLAPGRVHVWVVAGELAGTASLDVAGSDEPVQVELQPASVIACPRGPALGIAFESGEAVPKDPRWRDSRYRGWTINDDAWLVPRGRYRFTLAGREQVVELPPAHLLDLRVEGREPALRPLPAGAERTPEAPR